MAWAITLLVLSPLILMGAYFTFALLLLILRLAWLLLVALFKTVTPWGRAAKRREHEAWLRELSFRGQRMRYPMASTSRDLEEENRSRGE
jgi:hypothetical protein